MTDAALPDVHAPGFDIRPYRFDADGLVLLDQRLLPGSETWVHCPDVASVIARIKDLTVRGAPAIGVTAAYGLVIAAEAAAEAAGDAATLRAAFARDAAALRQARPTAVNLMWAVDRVVAAADAAADDPDAIVAAVRDEAAAVDAYEVAACRAMGDFGATFVPDGGRVLTHCNAGALATGGWGTALGVIRSAVAAGKRISVWVDETRPVLQGARLTAWELTRAGIPNTLIVDGAAASTMRRGLVDVAVVGADRIAANGDVANKIGTFGVALAARAAQIPFLVAAPTSTIDLSTPDGDAIAIEERDADEVRRPGAAPDQRAANPAFDVTPAEYVTAIVTERGIVQAPYPEALAALLAAD